MDTGTVIGTVVSHSGEVTARSENGETRPLELGSSVYANDQVVTGTDAAVVFEFADGSRKGMAGGSSISLDRQIYDPSPVATKPVAEAVVDATQGGVSGGTGTLPAEQIGEVASASGLVIARGADGAERALAIGDPVFAGETVFTDTGSLAIFRFADGSRKGLGSGSEISFESASMRTPVKVATLEPQSVSNDIELLAEEAEPAVTVGPVTLGRLESAHGDVFVSNAAGQERLLEPGDEILAGETVVTDEGAAAVVELGDGSLRGIASASEMAFNPDELPATAAGVAQEASAEPEDLEPLAQSDGSPDLTPEDAENEAFGATEAVAEAEPDHVHEVEQVEEIQLAALDQGDPAGYLDDEPAEGQQPVESQPDPGEPVATLTGVMGEVRALSSAGEERVLEAGDSLYAGDVVLTAEGSVAVISSGDQAARGLTGDARFSVDEWLDSLPQGEEPELADAADEPAPAFMEPVDEDGAEEAAAAEPEEPAPVTEVSPADSGAEEVTETLTQTPEHSLSLEEAQHAVAALDESIVEEAVTEEDADAGLTDAAAPLATISGVSGEVLAIQPDGTERGLDAGDEVFAGERILTGPNGTVLVDVGGVVRGLAGDSEVVVDELVAQAGTSTMPEQAATAIHEEEEPATPAQASEQQAVADIAGSLPEEEAEQPAQDVVEAVAEVTEPTAEDVLEEAEIVQAAVVEEAVPAEDAVAVEEESAAHEAQAMDVAPAGVRVGVLSSAMGDVEAESGDSIRMLEPGDAVFIGETLIVSDDGVAILHLDDGRSLGLSGGSSLAVDESLLQSSVAEGTASQMSAQEAEAAEQELAAAEEATEAAAETAAAPEGAATAAELDNATEDEAESVALADEDEAVAADVPAMVDDIASASAAEAMAEAGTVTALSGNVRAIDAEGNERPLDVGDVLYVGETVNTDPASTVIVQLNSGGARGIAGDSSLHLAADLVATAESTAAAEAPDAAQPDMVAANDDEQHDAVAEIAAEPDLEELSGDVVEAALAEVSATDVAVEVTPVAVAPEIEANDGAGDALPMGRLVSSLGEVRAVSAEGESRLLEVGDEIYPEETLVTDALGVATVELVDGSFRGISSDASLRMDESLLKAPSDRGDNADAPDTGRAGMGEQALAAESAVAADVGGEPVGTVNSLVGEVLARTADGGSRELAAGDEVFAGETLVTAEFSTAVIDFSDGTQRGLASNAEMELDSGEISLETPLAMAASEPDQGGTPDDADLAEVADAAAVAAAEPVSIGSVSAATGSVEAIAEDGSVRELAVGDPIFEGETLETGMGATAVIVLNDGSVRGLAGGSSAKLHLETSEPDAAPRQTLAGAESPLIDLPDAVAPGMDDIEPAEGMMVGAVSAVSGTVIARSVEGGERELQAGDSVYENETIWTEAGSTVVIAMQDGTSKGLASGSVLRLDADTIDLPSIREVIESKAMAFGEMPDADADASGQVHDEALELSAMEDLDALQEAILAGADPSQEAEPTAAGWETTSEGSHEAVFIERSGQRTTPEAGNLTTAGLPKSEQSAAPDQEIRIGASVGAPVGGGADDDDLLAELAQRLGMTLQQMEEMLSQADMTPLQFNAMSQSQQREMVAAFEADRTQSADAEDADIQQAQQSSENPEQAPEFGPLSGTPLIVGANDVDTPDAPTVSSSRSASTFGAEEATDRVTNVLSEDRLEFSFGADDAVPGTTPGNVPSNLLAESLVMEFEAPEDAHLDPVIFNLSDTDTETFLIHNFHAEDGDILKVHDLLLDEGLDANQSTDAGTLAQYMHFDYDQASQSTRILVGHDQGGEFVPDHTIVLDQVDVTEGGALDDATIINNLISSNNLDVATAQSAGPAGNMFDLLDVTPGGEFLI